MARILRRGFRPPVAPAVPIEPCERAEQFVTCLSVPGGHGSRGATSCSQTARARGATHAHSFAGPAPAALLARGQDYSSGPHCAGRRPSLRAAKLHAMGTANAACQRGKLSSRPRAFRSSDTPAYATVQQRMQPVPLPPRAPYALTAPLGTPSARPELARRVPASARLDPSSVARLPPASTSSSSSTSSSPSGAPRRTTSVSSRPGAIPSVRRYLTRSQPSSRGLTLPVPAPH